MLTISEIKPYPKNAKKHPESQLIALAKIVKEVGWRQNVLVNQQGIIIAGHGRMLTYEKYKDEYGLKPIWILDDMGNTIYGAPETTPLTPEQEKAYRLADNKLNESDWIMNLAIEELKDLSAPMLDLTGFDKRLVLESSDKDDDAPEVPEIAQSKLGDIYELGGHRVMCGDATQQADVALLMGDRKADMFLTDPPYNVDYEGKTEDALKIQNDKMDNDAFRAFLTASFKSVDPVLKAGAVFYIWHADSEGFNFRGACHDVNWKVRQCLIWNKNSMVMGRQDYHWKHEPCLYGWKEGASHLWNSDRTQTTILTFDRPTCNALHPTMKPVDLLLYQIQNNTKGEDIILDVFLGSGSTVIASQKSGRICYGLELDPKYVDVIVSRYVEYTGSNEIVKNGEKILWQNQKPNSQN